jgi:hypothetical protein
VGYSGTPRLLYNSLVEMWPFHTYRDAVFDIRSGISRFILCKSNKSEKMSTKVTNAKRVKSQATNSEKSGALKMGNLISSSFVFYLFVSYMLAANVAFELDEEVSVGGFLQHKQCLIITHVNLARCTKMSL